MQKYFDSTVVEEAGGQYQVEWSLIAMDCPDCASKAMRTLTPQAGG